jgi:transposase
MSQFPDEAHLSSWAGVCPGNNESAGKKKSGKTQKGNSLAMKRREQSMIRSLEKAGYVFANSILTRLFKGTPIRF